METDLPPIELATDPHAPEVPPLPPRHSALPSASSPSPTLPPGRPRRRWGWLLRAPVLLAAAGLTAASAAGALGGWHWRLDYFANFPVQYLVLGVPVLLLLFFLRHWRVAGFFALVLGWNASLVMPLISGGPDPTAGAADTALRVVQKNVLQRNPQHDETIAWLREQDADVIVIQEMSDDWADRAVRRSDRGRRLYGVRPPSVPTPSATPWGFSYGTGWRS